MILIDHIEALKGKAVSGLWDFIRNPIDEEWRIYCEGSYQVRPAGGDWETYFMCDAKYYNMAPDQATAEYLTALHNNVDKFTEVAKRAEALREAQRNYMADRGNEELGQAVGKAAELLDEALAELKILKEKENE